MAHSYRFAIYLVSLFLGLSAFTSGHRGYRAPVQLSPARQRLLTIAHSHLGICEATGHNDGPEVERYQRATGNAKGAQWCSSHCASCYQEARIPLPRWVNGAARSWFVPPHLLYLNSQWVQPGVEPLPGDLLGYIYRSSPLVHHVGLQDSFWGSTSMVYDIEGNYGGCVKLVLRPKRSIGAIARYAGPN